MRTTVILPEDIMRAAKARSAERGESLKALLTRAVEAELGRTSASAPARSRVTLPLFGSGGGSSVRVSNADLARALADTDAATVPAARAAGRGDRANRRRR